MRATRVAGQLAVTLLSLSPAISALSWPRWLPAVDSLVARADTSSPSSAAQTASASSTAAETTTASATNAASQTNLNTAGITSSGSATGTASGSGSGATSGAASTTSHTTYDAESPAGSITMLTPSTTSGTQLYRIGEYITWGWNYTGLSATPTAIDLMVSCSTASETFTLTTNMTFETLGSYTWDTGAYQSSAVANPLPVAMYTMIIYDADSSISATAEAGYLAAYTGFQFGLYTGRPYTPLASGYVCATCSGGMSDMERRTVGVAVLMSICTVLSFTWFVAGFGAFI